MKIKRDFMGMFDVIKGLLMLIVVFGHHRSFVSLAWPALRPPVDGLLVYNDVVPMGMFFIIAGYGFSERQGLRDYTKRQARQMLPAYFVTMLVVVLGRIVRDLFRGQLRISSFSPAVLACLYGTIRPFELFGKIWVDSVSTLWFVGALFFGAIIHQALHKIKKPWVMEACVWGLTAAAVAMPDMKTLQIPWFLVQACASLGFLETGRLLKKHKLLHRRWMDALIPAAAVVWFLLCRYSMVNVASNIWQHWMLDYVGGTLVAAVLLRLYLLSGAAAARWADPLAYIGRYSLYFLCVHGAEMLLIDWSPAQAEGLLQLPVPNWCALVVSYVLRVAVDVGLCALVVRLSRSKPVRAIEGKIQEGFAKLGRRKEHGTEQG